MSVLDRNTLDCQNTSLRLNRRNPIFLAIAVDIIGSRKFRCHQTLTCRHWENTNETWLRFKMGHHSDGRIEKHCSVNWRCNWTCDTNQERLRGKLSVLEVVVWVAFGIHWTEMWPVCGDWFSNLQTWQIHLDVVNLEFCKVPQFFQQTCRAQCQQVSIDEPNDIFYRRYTTYLHGNSMIRDWYWDSVVILSFMSSQLETVSQRKRPFHCRIYRQNGQQKSIHVELSLIMNMQSRYSEFLSHGLANHGAKLSRRIPGIITRFASRQIFLPFGGRLKYCDLAYWWELQRVHCPSAAMTSAIFGIFLWNLHAATSPFLSNWFVCVCKSKFGWFNFVHHWRTLTKIRSG